MGERKPEITYTTPDNIRCRDSKLFDSTLLLENMELYFEMGGAAYWESRQDAAARNGEEAPTIDDAVGELAGAMDVLLSGDETRFHLETLHHSDEEVRRMLALGRKLTRTTVAVQDDDGEEEKRRIEKNLRATAELTDQLMRRMLDDNEKEFAEQNTGEEYEQYHGFGMELGI